MTVPAEAGTGTAANTATEQEAPKPTLDERIAATVEAKAARLGVTTDDAAAQAKGSEATTEAAAKAESGTAEEAEGDASANEEAKADEGRVFTAEDLGNPKFFYSLDKDGWAELTKQKPELAAGWKAIIAENTRREQNVAAREKALSAREGTKETPRETAARTETKVDGAALVDAINDPARVDEAAEMLADLPGFERAIDKLLQRKGISPEALAKTSQVNEFDTALAAATELAPALTRQDVLDEIDTREDDPQIIALLESPGIEAKAFGLRMAADRAELRLLRKAATTSNQSGETKAATSTKAEEQKQAAKAAAAKVKAKGTAITPATAEGNRKPQGTSEDKSQPLETRILTNFQRKADALLASRGGQ